MPDRLLFIEANTSGTGMMAMQRALSQGLLPVFFTNKPERYSDLQEINCPVHVCDTNNLAELQKVIEKHVQREEIRGITTTSEFYLEVVAELSARYGLPGNRPDDIRKARDKSLTRQILAEARICQPGFAIVRNVAEVAKAIRYVGLPCVLKPTDDSGSNGVVLCQTVEQAEGHAARTLAVKVNIRGQRTTQAVLVEQYLEGPEFSVEMFSWQGKTTCIGITQKSLTGFPYFVESRHLFPALLSEEQIAHMRETVIQALTAIGIQTGVTHTEVKWLPEGCAVIEINARLAGGMIPELIRLVTGTDMLEQQIRSVVDDTISLNTEARGVAGIQFLIADREGILLDIEGVNEAAKVPGVKVVQVTAKVGALVQPPQNAYHRLGYVIAHTDTTVSTQTCLQEAVNRIKLRLDNKEGRIAS